MFAVQDFIIDDIFGINYAFYLDFTYEDILNFNETAIMNTFRYETLKFQSYVENGFYEYSKNFFKD